jgi:murein DD-endopeptidase MepM/ murein hydrolase activator NlpD
VTEFKKNSKSRKQGLGSVIGHFPRHHMVLVACLGACLVALSALFPSKDASATRQSLNLDLALPSIELDEALLEVTEVIEPEWLTLEVKSGDNLSLLFQRAGLTNRDVYEFTSGNDDAKALRKIFPGHQLAFAIDTEGKLQQLRHIENKLTSKLYSRQDTGFTSQASNRVPDVKPAYRESVITSSLVAAAKAPGVNMSDSLTMALADIFGWDIDFALDIRRGDSFKVLYEEKFLDGERLGHGEILAAEFINQGDRFQAVRFVGADGRAQYYTPEGKSMRKEFLRAPLDFRRISSGFNPNRLHPIAKTVRPHRGTDYAADRGTPVWASGDGRVIRSSYDSTNGNIVVIQHGNGIQTKYLHLNKRYVKNGERVRQKQTIGSVGSTGLATGPHLHYEFLLNGVHRNPSTIVKKLPQAKSVEDNQLANFSEQVQPLIAQLNRYHQATQIALAESTNPVN